MSLNLFSEVAGLIRLYRTRLPVTRKEVMEALIPIYGRSGARLYFSGLRLGYIHGGLFMSGRHPCYSQGLRDGSRLKDAPDQWYAILQYHLSKRPRSA